MYRRYRDKASKTSHLTEEEECDRGPVINGHVSPAPLPTLRTNRKLILHFDARNTIFVADHSSRISVEKALNTYIAGVVWGIYKEDGSWECISEEPTLCTPDPRAISMYKLMERDIVTVPSDRARLRQELGDFTQREVGAKFVSYFHHHLSMLEWKNKQIDDNLTVTGNDGRRYHYLLPSFLNLIAHLHSTKVDFVVIIRTFGRDAPHILTALKLMINGLHPDFPHKISVPVNMNVERLNRVNGYEYLYTRPDGTEGKLYNERDIYEHWNNCHGVMGVVDDFVFWQSNNYHFSASKPLWFDANDKHHQHIMFDDNIRVDDEDNILNLCRLQSKPAEQTLSEAQNGHSRVVDGEVTLTPNEARHFENVFFVQADLLESTARTTYFIDQTQKCIDNLDRLRKNNPTLVT